MVEASAAGVWVLGLDGDPVARAARSVLGDDPRFAVAHRPDAAHPPGVIVLAPSLQDAVARHVDDAPCVALLPSGSDARAARSVLSAGAVAAILEQDVAPSLCAAVAAALDGLVTLSRDVAPVALQPALTPREKQVLALVVMGLSNREIAAQLVVSESTIKSHLFSAFRRLGVHTRSQAVALITDPQRGLGSGILTIAEE